MADRQNRFGRRAFVLGCAGSVAAGLAACTAGSGGTDAATSPATTASTDVATTAAPQATVAVPATTARPTTTALPALPASRVFPISANEPEPVAKERAVRLVEAVSAWTRGQGGVGPATRRLVQQGIPAPLAGRLAAASAPFLGSSLEATSAVISVQYGGLTETAASLLVTFRQWTRGAGVAVAAGGSAADVRLSRLAGGQWAVSEVHPAQPGAAVQPPPALVQQVLTHPRIHLPPSAAADIAAGDLMPRPMRTLLALAGTYEIDIAIVHTAHPTNVFATNRLSDHTRRRAWDVWAVNKQAVIDSSTPDALVDGFMRDAHDAGAYNIGGPRLLSGAGFFSDRTHRDHCHIAFNADS